MLAAAGGHTQVVRQLLASAASTDLQNRHGDTALILASQAGDLESVRALLAAGASRKLRNRDGVAAADAAKARSFDALVAVLN